MSEFVSNMLKELGMKEGVVEDQTFKGWFKNNLFKREFTASTLDGPTRGMVNDLMVHDLTGIIALSLDLPAGERKICFDTFIECVQKGIIKLHD